MASADLEKRRLTRLRSYAIDQALQQLEKEKPGFKPEAIVASICAYEEEGNIGGVLEKMPETINGERYTTLVVVDGGDDRTAEIARSFPGVAVIEFPVNLGHGVALQVTTATASTTALSTLQPWTLTVKTTQQKFPKSSLPSLRTSRTLLLPVADSVWTKLQTDSAKPVCSSSPSS